MRGKYFAWGAALVVPILYFAFYTPYGMDTTDFGYFYGYAWRILQGQIPYRDFFYIKPCLPLYWHAFWLALTPENYEVLAGKAGFCATILASAWFCALYLRRFLDFRKFGLSLPLLATCGFVFGVHTFPHMPWHTADGVFFCAASLLSCAAPLFAGVFAACAVCCKQSFALFPVFMLAMLLLNFSGKAALRFLVSFCLCLAAFYFWLKFNGAWEDFRAMTTGQLDIREALDAGVLIYLRQNWLVPIIALLPALLWRMARKRLPPALEPGYCYLFVLAVWYIGDVLNRKIWIGFGLSWPTLFMLLAGAIILFPRIFLAPLLQKAAKPAAQAAIFAAPAIASWSVAISGGYKIPALFATPLLAAFFIVHARFYGSCRKLAWAALAAGLLMFGVGYQYPYVFPERPLTRSDFKYDAGEIYPRASGVIVDRNMYERLKELKYLAAKYGPKYKTLPGFSFSYYLNRDYPQIASDWLIDWEINGQTDRLYNELVEKDITVLMERDQMNVARADAYERAAYSVPQRVVKLWRKVDETPHFVVFQKPDRQ